MEKEERERREGKRGEKDRKKREDRERKGETRAEGGGGGMGGGQRERQSPRMSLAKTSAPPPACHPQTPAMKINLQNKGPGRAGLQGLGGQASQDYR